MLFFEGIVVDNFGVALIYMVPCIHWNRIAKSERGDVEVVMVVADVATIHGNVREWCT